MKKYLILLLSGFILFSEKLMSSSSDQENNVTITIYEMSEGSDRTPSVECGTGYNLNSKILNTNSSFSANPKDTIINYKPIPTRDSYVLAKGNAYKVNLNPSDAARKSDNYGSKPTMTTEGIIGYTKKNFQNVLGSNIDQFLRDDGQNDKNLFALSFSAAAVGAGISGAYQLAGKEGTDAGSGWIYSIKKSGIDGAIALTIEHQYASFDYFIPVYGTQVSMEEFLKGTSQDLINPKNDGSNDSKSYNFITTSTMVVTLDLYKPRAMSVDSAVMENGKPKTRYYTGVGTSTSNPSNYATYLGYYNSTNAYGDPIKIYVAGSQATGQEYDAVTFPVAP